MLPLELGLIDGFGVGVESGTCALAMCSTECMIVLFAADPVTDKLLC